MKAAVICSKGMGDGLMMMVASHALRLKGYEVTTFQDSLEELEGWFPNQKFAKRSTIKNLENFDFILLQNDNTPFSYDLASKYRDKIHIFYANYEEKKHLPLTPKDIVFDRFLPLVTNIAKGIASLLGAIDPLTDNGLVVPKGLIYRKYPKRILIHPTSTSPKRTWTKEKFLLVAKKLEKEGFEPLFCLSPEEKKEWGDKIHAPTFPTLSELAATIYESHLLIGNESGTGHLASNLGIPTLIIASCPKQMTLWRPGFLLGRVVTPPRYIPNFKLLRLREKKWQTFISPRRILKTFHKMQTKNV